eukprot:3954570-Pyramimonas_sp.AAC.1
MTKWGGIPSVPRRKNRDVANYPEDGIHVCDPHSKRMTSSLHEGERHKGDCKVRLLQTDRDDVVSCEPNTDAELKAFPVLQGAAHVRGT